MGLEFDPTFNFFKKLVLKSLAEKLKQTFPKNVKHFLWLPKKNFIQGGIHKWYPNLVGEGVHKIQILVIKS